MPKHTQENSLAGANERKVDGIDFKSTNTSDFDQYDMEVKRKRLINLLNNHPFSKDDIHEAFRLIPNISHVINVPVQYSGFTLLHLYAYSKMNIEVVRMLLENGDINIKRPGGDSVLTFLIKMKRTMWRNTEFEYRQILELFIYSNPSLDQNKTEVAQGLELDAELVRPDHGFRWGRPEQLCDYFKENCRGNEPWKYVCHEVLQEHISWMLQNILFSVKISQTFVLISLDHF